MNKKATDIVAYLSPLGLILAFIFGDRENSKFHLNQALVLFLTGILVEIIRKVASWLPLIRIFVNWACGIIGLVLFIFWIIGFAAAISGVDRKVPVLGEIKLL